MPIVKTRMEELGEQLDEYLSLSLDDIPEDTDSFDSHIFACNTQKSNEGLRNTNPSKQANKDCKMKARIVQKEHEKANPLARWESIAGEKDEQIEAEFNKKMQMTVRPLNLIDWPRYLSPANKQKDGGLMRSFKVSARHSKTNVREEVSKKGMPHFAKQAQMIRLGRIPENTPEDRHINDSVKKSKALQSATTVPKASPFKSVDRKCLQTIEEQYESYQVSQCKQGQAEEGRQTAVCLESARRAQRTCFEARL